MADGAGSVGPEPATAAEQPAYDGLGEAKRLLRTIRSGALATLAPDGTPFASLVSVATEPDGSPLLLLSRLAAHTRHLEERPRCSLLLARGGRGDPLAHPRLTVTGSALALRLPGQRAPARARFLARQPKAALYADFPDFAFWRLHLEEAHLNGGFARAGRFAGEDLRTPTEGCEALVEAEADAIAHLNRDHRDALQVYATVLARAPEAAWSASGIDPEGLDLVAGDRAARLVFPEPVRDPATLRGTLVALATAARALAAPGGAGSGPD